MKRRDFMKSAAALTATAGAGSLAAPLAHADIPALNATVRRITGDAPLSAGRVKLDLPVLAAINAGQKTLDPTALRDRFAEIVKG